MESNMFSAALVRGLTDKTYEKRKAAALEIERLARDNEKSPEKITAIIDTLVQEFVYSNIPTARYGGLIGLAATAIALGPSVGAFLDSIVPPILSCFTNQDQRVRYYACESMYNISRVAKGEVLPFFNSIFDALCKLCADTEPTVRNGVGLLDRLIKDIVCELSTTYISPHQPPLNPPEFDEVLEAPPSLPRNTAFSLPQFIPLLSKRVHVRNSSSRQYLVSWISVLDDIPDLELVSFLPKFLDGLILCLNDTSDEVRESTSVLLAQMLEEIKNAALAVQEQQQHQKQQQQKMSQRRHLSPPPGQLATKKSNAENGADGSTVKEATIQLDAEVTVVNENDGHGRGTYVPGQGVCVHYDEIVAILLPHLSSTDEEIQRTALQWIHAFLSFAKDIIIHFAPEIVKALLPSLAHPVSTIRTSAVETNKALQTLVLDSLVLPEPSESQSDLAPSQANSTTLQRRANRSDQGRSVQEVPGDQFNYQAMVANLRLQFLDEHEETRVASLEWLLMLHMKVPNKILEPNDGTFPALLKTLSDTSEEVVRRDLQLLAQMSLHSDSAYFKSFMSNLLLLFSTDRRLLESRGSLIVRQLCVSLGSERIYRTIAEILETDEDLEFASIMVQNLNTILITSSEVSDLRKRLRNLDNKDDQKLFMQLYRTWCHNAVSTFSLCLLAQSYEHASNMLHIFAELDMTVSMLIQVDKLVQLLESPVFTYLRLQLLEPERYPYLFKCLYGILMLLPQSSAFSTLRNRLDSVSSLGFLHAMPKSSTRIDSAHNRPPTKDKSSKPEDNIIRFQELLQHFKDVQSKHERQRRQVIQSTTRNTTARNRRARLAYGNSSGAAGKPASPNEAEQAAKPLKNGTNSPSFSDRLIGRKSRAKGQ